MGILVILMRESTISLIDCKNKKKKLSNETKNKILYTFKIVLNEAEALEMISRNPIDKIDLFAPNNKERKPFSHDELKLLFPEDRTQLTAIWLNQMWLTFFIIQATCGLRPGEVAALRWQDWFKNLHGLVICQSVENRTKTLKGLKTSKKGVKMKPALLTKRCEQELLFLEMENKDNFDLIFHLGNGKPIQLDTSNKHFKGACKRAKIKRDNRTQYCLRHSFSTDLLVEAPLDTVNRLMGHTKYRPEYDHRQGEALLIGAQGAIPFIEKIRGL